MPHLYPHKRKGYQIIYYLYFPEGQRKKKWRYARNKLEAHKILQAAEKLEIRAKSQMLSQDEVARFLNFGLISHEESERLCGKSFRSVGLEMLADEFLDRSEIECRSQVHEVNRIRIRHLLDYFGDELPTFEQIEKYRIHRIQDVGANTINKEITKLAQLLDIAVGKGVIEHNPARKLKRLRDKKERKPRSLTREEIKSLLDTAKKEKTIFGGLGPQIVLTYLYTGMRLTELLWLEWEDIDLRRRKITIQAKKDWNTKTGKFRTVGIAKKLFNVLSMMARTGYFVFGGDKPFMNNDAVTHAFKKLVRRGNLSEAITLHSLRHTYISHLLEKGVPLPRVMELAGISELSTIMRYIHALPSDKIEEDLLDF